MSAANGPEEPTSATSPEHHEPPDDERREIARLREALAAANATVEQLRSQLSDAQGRLDQANSTINEQQSTIGRLGEVAGQVDRLAAERDQLRGQLNDVQGALSGQVASAVQDRVETLTTAQSAQIEDLTRTRDQLQQRVTELENAVNAEPAPSMATGDFAGHFVQVLSGLSSEQPAGATPWSAAVTGISVQAKGLLRPGTDGGVDIVTPEAGAVAADQLSTVSFDLKLLPRIGAQTPGGGQAPPTGPS